MVFRPTARSWLISRGPAATARVLLPALVAATLAANAVVLAARAPGTPGAAGTDRGAAAVTAARPAGKAFTGHASPAERAAPVEVHIPRIGVRSRLVGLRTQRDGTLQVPQDYARAGWWVGGPTPGDAGAAVIAGHVDSDTGEAVFFRLRSMRVGDDVVVRRSDGRLARFRVRAVERHAKTRFPTERVYVSGGPATLRLITCGGSFDERSQSYRDNVVVYADAVPRRPAAPPAARPGRA